MMKLYKSQNGKIIEVNEMGKDIWINLVNPNEEEIALITNHFSIDAEDIRASLDNEEYSRVESFKDYSLILVDVPLKEIRHENNAYTTLPLSIIFNDTYIITTSLKDTGILNPFFEGTGYYNTAKRMRLIYQILYRIAVVYQTYLRLIDHKRREMESELNNRTKKSDLIQLHELESNLVYFAMSLRANDIVLHKLLSSDKLERYSEDLELLNDTMIENRQAIEMTNIYRSVLSGTRELFASILDNNLNTVMKLMTSVTLIMSIPTVISGFYGMNVNGKSIPFAATPNAFIYITIATLFICAIIALILKKKDML
ncbi:MAG: magnesium transporter CorA family protein [Erysipelotrichaceae bacterium]